MRKILIMICSILFLTGCWNNIELDNEALVHGVGLDKTDEDDLLRMSVEIVKPVNTGGGSGSGDQQAGGQHIVLETEAETLLEAARKFIRSAKRRLYFGHARVWVVGNRLAKDDFVRHLDIIRRDQMLRVNSYLFISDDDPKHLLDTSTLYENLTSTELVSGLEQLKFSIGLTPIKLYEFFRLIEGPVQNAYIPIIKVESEMGEKLTKLNGAAVINNNKMVGKLNEKETMGLSWLMDNVKGGAISVSPDKGEVIAYEITKSKTKIKPKLKGKNLKVAIEVEVEGTLGDNVTTQKPSEQWFTDAEKNIQATIESRMSDTLKKLQKELKTDITNIGQKTHQTYPKEWKKIQSDWDEKIFANADVSIDVKTKLIHKGLINKSKIDGNQEKPHNNPYNFLR